MFKSSFHSLKTFVIEIDSLKALCMCKRASRLCFGTDSFLSSVAEDGKDANGLKLGENVFNRHRKVLLNTMNGHTLGFYPQTQKLEPPCTA